MFIYHNVMSLIKICFFCFSTYVTENRDMTHSRAYHMLACHCTYLVAPCFFLAQTEPYFRSQSAILWLCDVVLHAVFWTMSTTSSRLSQRKCSFCCITCLILIYFFSLISHLTEGSLSYHMFDAQLFFGLNVYLTENTVVTTTAGVSHLWFPVVWLTQSLCLYCGCFESTRKLWGGNGSHCGRTCGDPVGDLFFLEFLSIWHPTEYSGCN
jgi:hypothetical protein